ncbi:MAG: poly-beta-1,6-N-acetyl-D-glucosamine biosynthesis protein PgaD, partial [Acidobacteriaceae bacterium]
MKHAQSPLIIYYPERQSTARRTLFGALTFTIWLIWFYLWLPLITAILWAVGVRNAYIQVFAGARGVGLESVGVVTLISIVLVCYWSNYNRIRYAKSTRRQRAKTVSKAVIGEKFGVSNPATMSLLLKQRRLILYFDQAGQLTRVEPLTNDVPGSAVDQESVPVGTSPLEPV